MQCKTAARNMPHYALQIQRQMQYQNSLLRELLASGWSCVCSAMSMWSCSSASACSARLVVHAYAGGQPCRYCACQYCEAGSVKYPTGTAGNATCVLVALACGNGSYADGNGVCRYCNATSVPDLQHTQCYPCSDPRAVNGGPGMIKVPANRSGSCVADTQFASGQEVLDICFKLNQPAAAT